MIELGHISIKNNLSILSGRKKVFDLAIDCEFSSFQAAQITSVISEMATHSIENSKEMNIGASVEKKDGTFHLLLEADLATTNLGILHSEFFDEALIFNKGDDRRMVSLSKRISSPLFFPDQKFVTATKKKLETLSRDELLSKLKNANEEVTTALDELKEMQTQLVQSEKMAALGQLTSSIAHEVNNPLGAIQASNGNIGSAFGYILKNTAKIHQDITSSELQLMNKLIELSSQQTTEPSSKEQRSIKRSYETELENLGVESPDTIAELLIDLKLFDGYEAFKQLIMHPKAIDLLDFAYNFSLIRFNSLNIERAVKRAAKTVFALKKYSHKTNTDTMVETDISENINTVLIIYNNQLKEVELEKDFASVPRIMAYEDELGQVWTNLIHNALHAIKENGTIKISVFEENDAIHISVEDNGHGIPKEIQEKVFTPFFTTKAQGEGSGLGLDIVLKIVKKHNGQIELESELSKGTKFTVILPITTEVESSTNDSRSQ